MSSTAVKKYEPADYKKMLMGARDTIAALIPKGMDPDRITRIAWLACHKDEKLLKSDPVTLVTAVVQAAQLGLEMGGPLQQAFPVPYWNRDKGLYDVQMQPGYRGFIELMVRGGSAQDVFARVVRKQDHFRLIEGSEPKIEHEPAIDGTEQDADIIGAYAVAVLPSGIRKHEWVPISRILQIRDRVLGRQKEGNKTGPWVTDFVEMCRKTPVRVLAKYVRITPELAAAIELDNRAETGEITAPLDGFDTPDSIVANVREKTLEKAHELQKKLEAGRVARDGGQVAEAEGEQSSSDGAPAGSVSTRAVPEAASPLGVSTAPSAPSAPKQAVGKKKPDPAGRTAEDDELDRRLAAEDGQ